MRPLNKVITKITLMNQKMNTIPERVLSSSIEMQMKYCARRNVESTTGLDPRITKILRSLLQIEELLNEKVSMSVV